MGEHREKHTIFGPFPDADPLDTARLFLRTNRYRVVTEEAGPTPRSLQIDPSIVAEVKPLADQDEEPRQLDEPSEEAHESEATHVENVEDEEEADEEEADEEEAAEEEADEEEAAEEQAAEEQAADEEAAEEVDEEADAPEPEAAPPKVERLDEIVMKLEAARGERWAGFKTSNMADLETRVELAVVENSIQIEYIVNTTGQFLNDDERQYWKHEAKALEAFVTGGDLVSVVSDESSRAARARRDLLGRGLWFAAIVFVVVFVGGVLIVRFA